MSRTQHPLDRMIANLDVLVDTSKSGDGFNWVVKLTNIEGDTITQSGHFDTTPNDKSGWHSVWVIVNGQLEWSKCLLLAHPIVRSIPPTWLTYITDIRIDRDGWVYDLYPLRNILGHDLSNTMQSLSTQEFAAVQHLCKSRLMQNP